MKNTEVHIIQSPETHLKHHTIQVDLLTIKKTECLKDTRDKGDIQEYKWVPTKDVWADALTKMRVDPIILKKVLRTGYLKHPWKFEERGNQMVHHILEVYYILVMTWRLGYTTSSKFISYTLEVYCIQHRSLVKTRRLVDQPLQ